MFIKWKENFVTGKDLTYRILETRVLEKKWKYQKEKNMMYSVTLEAKGNNNYLQNVT